MHLQTESAKLTQFFTHIAPFFIIRACIFCQSLCDGVRVEMKKVKMRRDKAENVYTHTHTRARRN